MVFLLAPDHKRFFSPALAGLALCLLFGWICAQFYLPGKGFTYLIEIGGTQHERLLPALKAVNHFEIQGAPGYDAQYYAQIAMEPNLGNPNLHRAVDSLAYRARRILLSWIAYALAGGNPVRALQVFAFENIVCWFALAALLCRWAPPWKWTGLLRWAALLFSFGLACSVRGSLVDGPSLFLIAAAIALAEENHLWTAAIILGIAGLAKETNLLAGVILLPTVGSPSKAGGGSLAGKGARVVPREEASGAGKSSSPLQPRRAWGFVGRWAVVAAPLVAWLVVLQLWVGKAGDVGARNFAGPAEGYRDKWSEVVGRLQAHGFDWVGRLELIVLVSLTVQWLTIVVRPQVNNLWWRVAAAYAVLGVAIGSAVWEGYPGAAARVLLPMTAAFLLLTPLRKGNIFGWLVFALGAASVLATPNILAPPGRESVSIHGPRDLRLVAQTGATVDALFGAGWYEPERSWLEYWRWCRASGDVTFTNPHPFPVTADIRFGLRANEARTVAVRTTNRTLWLGRLAPASLREVTLQGIILPPGQTTWRFESLEPPTRASVADARELSFSLRDLRVNLR